MTTAREEIPQAGTLVEVRGQRWVVGEEPLPGGEGSTLLTLQSVEDGRYGESLPVIWEVEPGRRILPRRSLPEVTQGGFDPPERLAAFLDAVRWSAVTSAEVNALQAPLRSGVVVEPYQLEPVARAIEAPRTRAASSSSSMSACLRPARSSRRQTASVNAASTAVRHRPGITRAAI